MYLDAWHWVMDWSDMLSVGNMTLILDKFFFPRWLQTLAVWLNHNPNYTQVTEWYSGWKRMVSDELLNQPSIKGWYIRFLNKIYIQKYSGTWLLSISFKFVLENFHKALEMMNRAVNIGQQPGAKESISYLKNIEENGITPSPASQPRVEVSLFSVLVVSLYLISQ